MYVVFITVDLQMQNAKQRVISIISILHSYLNIHVIGFLIFETEVILNVCYVMEVM